MVDEPDIKKIKCKKTECQGKDTISGECASLKYNFSSNQLDPDGEPICNIRTQKDKRSQEDIQFCRLDTKKYFQDKTNDCKLTKKTKDKRGRRNKKKTEKPLENPAEKRDEKLTNPPKLANTRKRSRNRSEFKIGDLILLPETDGNLKYRCVYRKGEITDEEIDPIPREDIQACVYMGKDENKNKYVLLHYSKGADLSYMIVSFPSEIDILNVVDKQNRRKTEIRHFIFDRKRKFYGVKISSKPNALRFYNIETDNDLIFYDPEKIRLEELVKKYKTRQRKPRETKKNKQTTSPKIKRAYKRKEKKVIAEPAPVEEHGDEIINHGDEIAVEAAADTAEISSEKAEKTVVVEAAADTAEKAVEVEAAEKADREVEQAVVVEAAAEEAEKAKEMKGKAAKQKPKKTDTQTKRPKKKATTKKRNNKSEEIVEDNVEDKVGDNVEDNVGIISPENKVETVEDNMPKEKLMKLKIMIKMKFKVIQIKIQKTEYNMYSFIIECLANMKAISYDDELFSRLSKLKDMNDRDNLKFHEDVFEKYLDYKDDFSSNQHERIEIMYQELQELENEKKHLNKQTKKLLENEEPKQHPPDKFQPPKKLDENEEPKQQTPDEFQPPKKIYMGQRIDVNNKKYKLDDIIVYMGSIKNDNGKMDQIIYVKENSGWKQHVFKGAWRFNKTPFKGDLFKLCYIVLTDSVPKVLGIIMRETSETYECYKISNIEKKIFNEDNIITIEKEDVQEIIPVTAKQIIKENEKLTEQPPQQIQGQQIQGQKIQGQPIQKVQEEAARLQQVAVPEEKSILQQRKDEIEMADNEKVRIIEFIRRIEADKTNYAKDMDKEVAKYDAIYKKFGEMNTFNAINRKSAVYKGTFKFQDAGFQHFKHLINRNVETHKHINNTSETLLGTLILFAIIDIACNAYNGVGNKLKLYQSGFFMNSLIFEPAPREKFIYSDINVYKTNQPIVVLRYKQEVYNHHNTLLNLIYHRLKHFYNNHQHKFCSTKNQKCSSLTFFPCMHVDIFNAEIRKYIEKAFTSNNILTDLPFEQFAFYFRMYQKYNKSHPYTWQSLFPLKFQITLLHRQIINGNIEGHVESLMDEFEAEYPDISLDEIFPDYKNNENEFYNLWCLLCMGKTKAANEKSLQNFIEEFKNAEE